MKEKQIEVKVGSVVKTDNNVYRIYDETSRIPQKRIKTKDVEDGEEKVEKKPKKKTSLDIGELPTIQEMFTFDKDKKEYIAVGTRMAYADKTPKNCPLADLGKLLSKAD